MIPPFAEELQVVHYNAGEYFGLHHDAAASFQRRELTLLIYLNDVGADTGSFGVGEGGGGGETWFPFAPALYLSDESRTTGSGSSVNQSESGVGVMEALSQAYRLSDQSNNTGLRVKPVIGRAILFSNVRPISSGDDDDDRPDPKAVHAALPVPLGEEKWVANLWITGDDAMTS
mmetsp:Transcript_10381/g.13641  ORF Transcript_10381/g.13641 Transcript_10381/m.13641 type:complete len:174 (-) Transcript_10381:227-748(-)